MVAFSEERLGSVWVFDSKTKKSWHISKIYIYIYMLHAYDRKGYYVYVSGYVEKKL